MRAQGWVTEWHPADGWGVVECLAAPGGCRVSAAALAPDLVGELHVGDLVDLDVAPLFRGRPGFRYAATRVGRPGSLGGAAPTTGPAVRHRLLVALGLALGAALVTTAVHLGGTALGVPVLGKGAWWVPGSVVLLVVLLVGAAGTLSAELLRRG